MEIEINFDETTMERLLLCAADQEVSAEEIILRAIEHFIKRGNNIG